MSGRDPAVNQILNGVGWLGRPELTADERPRTEKQLQADREERLARIEQRNRELIAALAQLRRDPKSQGH